MTLIYDKPQAGPVTHALVIGVGNYPYLLGGTDPMPVSDCDGMGQLTSPPISARSITEWLLKSYRNPDKPLASLRLLLSADDRQIDNDRLTVPAPAEVDTATFSNVEDVVADWKDAGDQNEDNLLLFFFCGHGISQGPDVALLCEDYGSNRNDPFDQAINFKLFHMGMDRCAAKQQAYFVDACRLSSDSLIESWGTAGRPIIRPQVRTQQGRSRLAPVFYATLSGEAAFARVDQPSLFTKALIDGLKGGGASSRDGDWRVFTNELQLSISTGLNRTGQPRAQVPPGDNMAPFALHYLEQEPEVPVYVRCEPDDFQQGAEMWYALEGQEIERRPPEDSTWELLLKSDTYKFFAESPEYAQVAARRTIVPPYIKIPLKAV